MTSQLYSSANGARVTLTSLAIPFYGAWVADVAIASPTPLTGNVTLQIGNLSLVGTAIRQRVFAQLLTARLSGGKGNWGKAVPARAYANPLGVPLSMILRDVAGEVGATVRLAKDRSVGLFFVREAGPGSRVLRQLAGELWWPDAAGVTQIGARPSKAITSAATVALYDGGKGWLSVATEDLSSWLPGATFKAPTVPEGITIGAVRLATANDGKQRFEVLAA